jgi:hypothetical protein
MPPTNDVNEGALGSFRIFMRRQPQLSLLQYNAQAMFRQNKTQEFMHQKFQTEDHQFIRQMARNADIQGEEQKRKQMLVEYNEAKIQKKKAASEKRKKNATEKERRVASVSLIFDREEVIRLKGEKLKDHLLAFKKAGAPIPSDITSRSTVGQIRQALQIAVDSFKSGKWEPQTLSEVEDSELDSSEDILVILDDEPGWEDMEE